MTVISLSGISNSCVIIKIERTHFMLWCMSLSVPGVDQMRQSSNLLSDLLSRVRHEFWQLILAEHICTHQSEKTECCCSVPGFSPWDIARSSSKASFSMSASLISGSSRIDSVLTVHQAMTDKRVYRHLHMCLPILLWDLFANPRCSHICHLVGEIFGQENSAWVWMALIVFGGFWQAMGEIPLGVPMDSALQGFLR